MAICAYRCSTTSSRKLGIAAPQLKTAIPPRDSHPIANLSIDL
jgi:hypothetical protein